MSRPSNPKDEVERRYVKQEAIDTALERPAIPIPPSAAYPVPKRGAIATQVKRPHIAATLGTIDNILWAELKRLEERVLDGQELSSEEVNRFRVLSEVALKKVKEEREQEKHERMDDIDDNELLAAAELAQKLLEGQ